MAVIAIASLLAVALAVVLIATSRAHDLDQSRVEASSRKGTRLVFFALGLAVFAAVSMAQLNWADGLYATTFETNAWIENRRAYSDWPARLRMVDDLIENHDLEGSSRAEVESLLGPADETSYFRRWDFVYWLGPERGFIRIDSEWLVLRFDVEGRVSEFRLVRD